MQELIQKVAQEAAQERKRPKIIYDDVLLVPSINAALHEITGGKQLNARAWRAWWIKNREDLQQK